MSKAGCVRLENGHFRGASRAVGPKQVVFGLRMDIYAALAVSNVQSRCLLSVEWTFSRRQPCCRSKAGCVRLELGHFRGASRLESPKQAACVRRMDFSEKQSPKKSKASRLRPKNGHFCGVSRAVGPKQVVCRPKNGPLRKASAKKVQSKLPAARRVDLSRKHKKEVCKENEEEPSFFVVFLIFLCYNLRTNMQMKK